MRFLAFLLLLTAGSAEALTYGGGSIVGLMQQPTSYYYHAIQGAFLEVATEKREFMGRLQAWQRPKFVSGGFVDQDYGAYGTIGTAAFERKWYRINAHMGYGRIEGYLGLEENGAATNTDDSLRKYSLPGAMFAMDFEMSSQHVLASFGHQQFIGYAGREQFDAYVTWPYNFFDFRLAFIW